jgi:hypothetical protein
MFGPFLQGHKRGNVTRSSPACTLWTPLLDCTMIKKKIKIFFLIYKEIQSGAVAKSYIRKGFLIYEEMRKYFTIYCMRRPLVIYDFATATF